jgi:hypothetical protein
MRHSLAIAALVAALLVTAVPLSAQRAGAATSGVTVEVKANHLVNGAGATVRLLGVDRSGTEYACEEGWGIFDGPSSAASVAAIRSWHTNAVRLPLNEGCWLNLYTSGNDPNAIADPTPYEGEAYQNAIESYVSLLHAKGIAVILSLHGLDAPEGLSVAPMADEANSPTFWTSVATAFKDDPGVIFDLYNEPNNIGWSCWLSGCQVTTADGSYQTAGMQQLVSAVRSTGATQPIMLGGLQWSSNEAGWLSHEPTDPDHQLVVSFHNYLSPGGCNTQSCWNATLSALLKVVPVVTGESGEYDCKKAYVDQYMTWADLHHVSYLGWAWDATSPSGWTCGGGPSLITSYSGTPTPYGKGLESHLAALAGEGELPPSLK